MTVDANLLLGLWIGLLAGLVIGTAGIVCLMLWAKGQMRRWGTFRP